MIALIRKLPTFGLPKGGDQLCLVDGANSIGTRRLAPVARTADVPAKNDPVPGVLPQHPSKLFAKRLLGSAAVGSGMFHRSLKNRALILAFHRVSDEYTDGLTFGTRQFDVLCRFLSKNLKIVSLTEIVERVERGEDVSNLVALTFDDGYRDNFTFAAPILEKYGLPATMFVVTSFIGSSTVPWWDHSLRPAPEWMTWNELRSLRARGFDIGGHTASHIDLGTERSMRVRIELELSKHALEDRLEARISHFAYPYGGLQHITEENRRIVRDAGFRSCLSCHGGTVSSHSNPFSLNRVPISTWFHTPEHLALAVATRRV